MMKVIGYFFFRIYSRNRKKSSNDFESVIYAIMSMTILLFVNIVPVFYFFCRRLSLPNFFECKPLTVAVMLIIAFVFFMHFYRNKHYTLVIKKYENEDKKHKIIGGWCIMVYIILTFVILVARL